MIPQPVVLATRNAGKVREMRVLLEDLPLEIVPAATLAGAPDVVEDADTLRGNAVKKASTLGAFSAWWALADDTGLHVSALGGEPGVYSARYAGENCTPADNRQKLLRALRHASDRSAEFRTVIALIMHDEMRCFEGVCRGHITERERGCCGFGYDAIFVPAGLNRTLAELSPAEKNAISHRGKALQSCRHFLTDYFAA